MTAVDRPNNGQDERRAARAPDCPVDRLDCDGLGTYRCDEFVWGSSCRAWQARNGGYPAPQEVEVATPTPAEQLARRFHETYERLAPGYGYRTREESAKHWSEVPVRNRRLMIAAADELLALLAHPAREGGEQRCVSGGPCALAVRSSEDPDFDLAAGYADTPPCPSTLTVTEDGITAVHHCLRSDPGHEQHENQGRRW